MAEKKEKSIFAIISLILGIVAVLLFWTTVLGLLLALGAIVLGILGIIETNKGKKSGKGMAIAGLILGIVAIILLILAIVLLVVFVKSAVDYAVANANVTITNLSASA